MYILMHICVYIYVYMVLTEEPTTIEIYPVEGIPVIIHEYVAIHKKYNNINAYIFRHVWICILLDIHLFIYIFMYLHI
jgi:hypothetical protein